MAPLPIPEDDFVLGERSAHLLEDSSTLRFVLCGDVRTGPAALMIEVLVEPCSPGSTLGGELRRQMRIVVCAEADVPTAQNGHAAE